MCGVSLFICKGTAMQKFNLSDAWIEQYKNRKPDFGTLGEFVYLRTYSRIVEGENRNEQWWETIRRVVEGCFSIQKDHGCLGF